MGKKYIANIPNGTHLAPSKNTYGAKRGTLLSDYTNEIVGQAEFKEIDNDDNDEYDGYDNNYNDDSSLGSIVGSAIATGIVAAAGGLFAGAIEGAIEGAVNSSNNTVTHETEYERLVLSEKERAKLEKRKAKNEAKLEDYKEKERVRLEKLKLKNDLKLKEYTAKELRKSERRKQQAIIREENREKRNAAIKTSIRSLSNKLYNNACVIIKQIGFAITKTLKYLLSCFTQCIKRLFISLKIFFVNSYQKIIYEKSSIKDSITNNSDFVLSANINIAPNTFSEMVDETFDELRNNMSSQEAQLHFLKILLLSNELAKEIRALSNVSVNDDQTNNKIKNNYSAWQAVMERIITEKTARYVNYILECNGQSIDVHIRNSITASFSGGTYNGDDYVPISLEHINKALNIWDK